jgi:hypothetical protein
MSEVQEKVHVVMRDDQSKDYTNPKPVKVFDDQKDARAYARTFNKKSNRFYYYVVTTKKG